MDKAGHHSKSTDHPPESQVASAPKGAPTPEETRAAPVFNFGLFGNVPEFVILGGMILFVLGWGYLYGYYSAFGLSVNELDLDFHEILLRTDRVLSWGGYSLILGAIVAIVATIFMIGRKHRPAAGAKDQTQETERRYDWISPFLLVVLAIIVLAGGSRCAISAGRTDADTDMQDASSSLPLVRLVLQADRLPQGLLDPDLVKGNTVELGYRLLAHGKKGYYLFEAIRQDTGLPGVRRLPLNLNVVYIPDIAVLGVSINAAVRQKAQ